MTIDEVGRAFTYHPPKDDQVKRYGDIRDAAKQLAYVIHQCTPSCADQTVAIRKVREAAMIANAAIAINE